MSRASVVSINKRVSNREEKFILHDRGSHVAQNQKWTWKNPKQSENRKLTNQKLFIEAFAILFEFSFIVLLLLTVAGKLRK